MPQNQAFDDNNNAGGVKAPATSASQITSPRLDTVQSAGQKGGISSESNYNTALRRENPLVSLSSWTYNISWYILDPLASNYFAINGKLPSNSSNGNYYIIAQSGGVNSDLEPRALTLDKDGIPGPGKPGMDFYIDDLTINGLFPGADGTKTSTAPTVLDFKIIEPSGFTLLNRLAQLTKYINSVSTNFGISDDTYSPNLYQQNYLIAIRFYGYDEAGLPIESSKLEFDRKEIINPGNKYALFERYFPIQIGQLEWGISGKSVTYSIKQAVIVPYQVSFSEKRGISPINMTLEGDTVGSVLGGSETPNSKSLINQMNAYQQQLYKNGMISEPGEYYIEWVKNSVFDSTTIKNSSLIISRDYSKENTAMGSALTVQQSNVRNSLRNVTINTNKKEIAVSAGTSIAMLIDQVISNSRYISDTLIKENNNLIETETLNNPTTRKLQWYAINPVTEIKKWETKLHDWSYKITYQIVPFEVPYIRSPYVNLKSDYYGPVKKYEYYFTGKNTEIIKFEQSYDAAFYIPLQGTTGKDDSTKNEKATDPAPKSVNGATNANSTMSEPSNRGIFIENVRANLYSVADQAKAQITIMGDPDYLMDGVGYKIPESNTFGAFYANNLSLNPYGGQLYIEIAFKIAEDYTNEGVMDVDPTQTILFYPKEIQEQLNNEGLIYKLTDIVSTFNKGKFEQVINCISVPPSQFIKESDDPKKERDRETTTPVVNRATQTVGPNGGIIGGQAINSTSVARTTQYSLNGGIGGGDRVSQINPQNLTPAENGNTSNNSVIQPNNNKKPLSKTPVTKNTNTGITVDDDGLSEYNRYTLG